MLDLKIFCHPLSNRAIHRKSHLVHPSSSCSLHSNTCSSVFVV
nr:MAG TPA: hypothetical protein [Caudoviricetes sp.]